VKGFGPIRSGAGCAIVVAVVALSVSPSLAEDAALDPLKDLKKKQEAIVRGVVHKVVETVVASEPVKDTVHSTLEKVDQVADDVGDLTGAPDGPGGRVVDPRSRPNHSPRRHPRVSGPNPAVSGRAALLGVSATARLRDYPSEPPPVLPPATGGDDEAIEAARLIAFPLALALAVAAFLLVQDRLDRRDPKLRLAPVESLSGTVTFR
jgi:hypothetical protein